MLLAIHVQLFGGHTSLYDSTQALDGVFSAAQSLHAKVFGIADIGFIHKCWYEYSGDKITHSSHAIAL